MDTNTTHKLRLELALQLQRAQAADLQMLNEYKGKEVVIEAGGFYGGILSEVGSKFVHLTGAKIYDSGIDQLNGLYNSKPDRQDIDPKKVPDRTIAQSTIEKIALAEEVFSGEGDSK